jgi:hypothetical protein
MPTEAARLRKRAQWYRDFAKLGTAYERAWREQMAEYFDRMADELEKPPEDPKK